jgi:ATP-dependent DNA helicase RecQ
MAALGVPLSGKIPVDQMAAPGRAIARVTDLGLGPRVREVLGPERADSDVPEDLVQAAIKVLAAWDWEARPAAVVSIGSRVHPQLVSSLATRIARIGRLPYLGTVTHTGVSRSARSNSAQRLRALYGTFALSREITEALPGLAGKPILLVDDLTDTGWTLTLVARLLRESGSGPVLPFVLAVEA